jgi:hypothetical protein
MKRISSVLSMLWLVAATLAAPSVFARVAGAIYTTVSDGSEVNFNIYASKSDVYINGGPGKGAGTNASGLVPDGVYVFMVTSPDGQLLSTDPAECRLVQVTGGIVVGSTGTCPHLTGTLQAGGATAVQLMPYADTPNPGGEYKVWLTPLDMYLCPLELVTCDEGRNGFLPSESKTDNFKVNSVADEIDTRFFDSQGQVLDNRAITWFDTHGASNVKWSYLDAARVIMHEAHVESPEVGLHYISIANQPGCTVGAITVDGTKSRKTGPQTVPVRITKAMKNKGTFTFRIDVICTSTQ